MKKLLLISMLALAGCDIPVPPEAKAEEPKEEVVAVKNGCVVKTSSKLKNERRVSDILNLEKDIDPNGRCTVKFDLQVDGKTYHLEETEVGYEQIPSLCYYAKERARKNLLLELGGDFESEAVVACRSETS